MRSTEICLLGITSATAPTKSANLKRGSVVDVLFRLYIICELILVPQRRQNCARPDSDGDVTNNSGKPSNQGAEDCFDAADWLADNSEAQLGAPLGGEARQPNLKILFTTSC